MQFRVDPRSGNSLSVLGFGCMRLPRGIGGIDMKKPEQMLLKAIREGANYLDAAYLYSGSEAALGRVLADKTLRDSVYIATKLPIINCRRTEDYDRFFSARLKSLQTDYVDYYLMHNINSLAQWQEGEPQPDSGGLGAALAAGPARGHGDSLGHEQRRAACR